MKKGGYQILELNCKGNIKVFDDYGSVEDGDWINILNEDFNNLFKYKKTCLLKNLLINNMYLTLFCNVFTNNDKVDIYIIDSAKPNGYYNINSWFEDYFVIKLNDDYILLIKPRGSAIILKLYKGAITQ